MSSTTMDEKRVQKFAASTHRYEQGCNDQLDQTRHIRPPPKVVLPEFNEDMWRDPYDVPENFTSKKPFPDRVQQHPCYTTSNNEYGLKEIGDADRISKYYGLNGNFTRKFNGIMYCNEGLICGMTKSKVHSSLDQNLSS